MSNKLSVADKVNNAHYLKISAFLDTKYKKHSDVDSGVGHFNKITGLEMCLFIFASQNTLSLKSVK